MTRANEKSHESRTKCKCPRCKKRHFTWTWYTGGGTLYRYCVRCEGLNDNVDGEIHERICY